jgi:hypothetical protein
MTKKLTSKQLATWLHSLPETTPVWELVSNIEMTEQKVNAVIAQHGAFRQAAINFNEELRSLDSLLTANAENDAAENMRPELNDSDMIGYWLHYHSHLINAAACHWESAGRDLNAEIGRNVY